MTPLAPGRYAIEVSRPDASTLTSMGRTVSGDELLTAWLAMVKPRVVIRRVSIQPSSVLYELEVREPVELPAALPTPWPLTGGRSLEDLMPTTATDYERDTSGGPTMAGALETVAKAAVVVGVALVVAQVIATLRAPQKG
jgi:hypothetical protein